MLMHDGVIAQAVSLRVIGIGFTTRSVNMRVVALGQVSLRVFRFPLSISFHNCSIFTRVSSGGWEKGPLKTQFHRDMVSPQRNNKIKGKFVMFRHLLCILDFTSLRSSITFHVTKASILQSLKNASVCNIITLHE